MCMVQPRLGLRDIPEHNPPYVDCRIFATQCDVIYRVLAASTARREGRAEKRAEIEENRKLQLKSEVRSDTYGLVVRFHVKNVVFLADCFACISRRAGNSWFCWSARYGILNSHPQHL